MPNNVFDKHQLAIAKSTLKMHDAGARIMGGMTKEEARAFLRKQGWSDARIKKLEDGTSESRSTTMDSVNEMGRGARVWGMKIAKKKGGKHYQIDTKTDPANAFSDEDLGLKRSETALAAESFLERAREFVNEDGFGGSPAPISATKLRKSDKARRKRERRKVKKGTAKQKRARRRSSKTLGRLQKRKAIRRKQEKARKRRARVRGGRSRISVAPKTEE